MHTEEELVQTFEVAGGDFGRAGKASTKIKELLKEIGVDSGTVIRMAIAAYEAEMNVVMYARRGLLTLFLTSAAMRLRVEDEGPGIPDISLAMQEGYSTATAEMREMGFGAGMGLPNIRKNSDRFEISSEPGSGTRLDILIFLDQAKKA